MNAIAQAYSVRFPNALPGGSEYRCKVNAYSEHEARSDGERKLEQAGLNRRAYGAPRVELFKPKGRTDRANRQPRNAV